jgi:hypothetical protein
VASVACSTVGGAGCDTGAGSFVSSPSVSMGVVVSSCEATVVSIGVAGVSSGGVIVTSMGVTELPSWGVAVVSMDVARLSSWGVDVDSMGVTELSSWDGLSSAAGGPTSGAASRYCCGFKPST